MLLSFCILHFAFCIPLLSGCASGDKAPTTQPTNIRDRQDQALKDPMNYKVNVGDNSGHKKIWEFEDGFKKDVEDVLGH